MQIKTMMRHHHVLTRMTIVNKTTNKCWRGCGEKELLCTVGGNADWWESSMEINQKIKNGSFF